jgi:hypothetical protein
VVRYFDCDEPTNLISNTAYKIVKLVKNGVLMVIHIYAKVSPISLIIVPIFYPIALSLGIDMQWFAILIALKPYHCGNTIRLTNTLTWIMIKGMTPL